jgi:hypothetical protein
MEAKNKDKTMIGIEIYQATPLTFEVNTDYDFNEESDIKDLNILMDSEFEMNIEESKVGIKITITASSVKDNVQIFELVAFYEFGVFDLKDVIVLKSDKERLESEFAKKILNIAIGGMRGMLSIYLKSTPYKDFILPVANLPDELFNN